jgi:hypothetical protein
VHELYGPLLERDGEAISRSGRAFAAAHSVQELWIEIARFAVLAYAPSQHAKRAVMACCSAHALRDELGSSWLDMVIACANYAAQSRPPWSEPPILESIDDSQWPALETLDAEGDALLMLDIVRRLLPILGERGRSALQRMVMAELPGETANDEPLDPAGAPDSVQRALWRAARRTPLRETSGRLLAPYELARDYAQTLLAHDYSRRLPPEEADALLDAVHHNLAHGESYADFSFA